MNHQVKFTATPEQLDELKKDFLEFTGGLHPGEALEELNPGAPELRFKKYLELNVMDENKETVAAFLDSWGEDEIKGIRYPISAPKV